MRYTHILLLILALFLTSCGRDASKAFDKLKRECAESNDPKKQIIPVSKCREWFPVAEKESETVIKYLPGKPILVPGDTSYIPVMVDCDSLINKNGSSKQTVKVKIPVYLRVDTASIEKTVKVKDMQEIEYWKGRNAILLSEKNALLDTLRKKEADNHALKSKVRKANFVTFSLIGLIVLLLALWVLKKRFFK